MTTLDPVEKTRRSAVLRSGKVVNACEHGLTRDFCKTCKGEAAKVLSMSRHPSNYKGPEGAA